MNQAVATIEQAVLAALDEHDASALDAHALQLLLRRYRAGARDDIADAIGRGLAAALEWCAGDTSVLRRAAWVELFVEASTLSDDDRLLDAIAALTSGLRRVWTQPPLEHQAAAIGACLHAAGLARFRSTAVDVVDELERLVARIYEPGEPIGAAVEQVRTASTLLAAYALSGRLPYSMLAEELVQNVRRSDAVDFITACEAARVFARLAVLHEDADYRAGAILAPGVDYRSDAARLLNAHADEAVRRGAAGAIYAVAVVELESHPL